MNELTCIEQFKLDLESADWEPDYSVYGTELYDSLVATQE